MPKTSPRKGASRRSDIPPDVLEDLNQGRDETRTLVEWLEVDRATLLSKALAGAGLESLVEEAGARYAPVAGEGVMARERRLGEILHSLVLAVPDRSRSFEALSAHRSDVVRSWAASALGVAEMDFVERMARIARFADDDNMIVREIAWTALRPWIAGDLEASIKALEAWASGDNANLRRCAVEGTRPRGVWTRHIASLKEDPSQGLPILEPSRAHPSRYVQNAVANWLNDASKTRPDWVEGVCERWSAESPGPETDYIVARGLRSIRKPARASSSKRKTPS